MELPGPKQNHAGFIEDPQAFLKAQQGSMVIVKPKFGEKALRLGRLNWLSLAFSTTRRWSEPKAKYLTRLEAQKFQAHSSSKFWTAVLFFVF